MMDADRKTAILVGVLYIAGTVAGVLSNVVAGPFLKAPDVLNVVAANAGQVALGALFVLVMGLALAMVPVVMFPILKGQNEALAIGFVVFRGALETLIYIAVAMCWLLLVIMAGPPAGSGTAVVGPAPALGALLLKAQNPLIAILDIVFSLGALMFNSLLYQSRLIPRWISGWGIAAVLGYLTAGLIALFSTHLEILLMPLALQEMVMAIWLIVKGFNPSVIASLPTKQI